MDTIQVTLPDGTRQQLARGVTPLEIAESISPRLAKVALAAQADDRLIDLIKQHGKWVDPPAIVM